MFFQVLFIIVICLGIFLFSSWFFSCLYTEWQMDAAERARKKQEEELQVVKEQDPDGVEESSFIEETSINVEDIPQDKKNKKQGYNIPMQMGEGTLPSSQVLSQVYTQNEKKNKSNQKQNHQYQLQYQQLQQANQIKQQFPNLSIQEIQQHQMKQYQQQVAQQHQLEQQLKFIDIQQAQKLHLQQTQQQQQALQQQAQQQLALQQQQAQQIQQQQMNQASSTKNSKKIEPVEVVQEQIQQSILEQHLLKSQAATNSNIANEANTVNVVVPEVILAAEIIEDVQDSKIVIIEKEVVEEIKKEVEKIDQKTESIDSQATQIDEEIIEIVLEENLIQDKLPYRERKLEEYEFFKTAFEIIDLSNNIKEVNIDNSYMLQFEDAITEADNEKTKIDWTLVSLLNANNHLTAIEELSVLLDQFLNSKFFKKINRVDKIQVIEQLLRSVLSIITKRLKCPAKNVDHQGDLLWIWNEIKDNLEREKERIKTSKPSSTNQNVNKPNLPPKPQKTFKPMNV